MDKLKPCPFCGGKAELENSMRENCSRIKCTKCRVKTEAFIKSFKYSSDQLAAEAWNRRVNDAAD